MALTRTWVDASRREDAIVPSEPKHHDSIRHGAHDLHVVADDHHAQAAVPNAFDQVQYLGRLRNAEGGGRFVEKDDPWIHQQGTGDRDRLTLTAGEGGDRFPDARDARRELCQQRPGADFHRHLVELQRGELPPEKDVGDDVEVFAQRQVLKHRRDPEA